MYKCYESSDAVDAHVVATYLSDHEIPVTLFDEASSIIGYGAVLGSLRLMVPDEFSERAAAVMAQRGAADELPEDPEYVFEGAVPPALSPWEFALSPLQLLRQIGIVLVAFFLFGLVVFVAMLMEMWVAMN